LSTIPLKDTCEEPDTIPAGIPDSPLYTIWLEPDTSVGLSTIPLNDICSEPDTNVGLFATLLYSTYEALVADPVIVAFIPPATFKDPDMVALPVTVSEPDIFGEFINIFYIYINVAIDFILQPLVLVCMFSCTFAPDMATEDVTSVVVPISIVELSVKAEVVPFHTDIISPERALDPLVTVYLKKAEVYEPVACVKTVLDPFIEEVTVA
jgi:hypothetical protein